MPLVPDLIYGSNLIVPRYLLKNKNRAAFQDVLPDHTSYRGEIWSYLVLKIIAQNKGKGVSGKKKTMRDWYNTG